MTAPTASTAYLHEVLALLWPGSTTSLRRRPWAERRDGTQERLRSFVALPNARHPAILVPSGPRHVTATALREAKTGGARGRRQILALAALAADAGLLSLLGARTVVRPASASPAHDVIRWLSDRLDTTVQGALPGGPSRANRKPIIHLISPSGVTVGFAKVGTNPLTKALVAAEADALRHLESLVLPGIRVPRLLLHERWNDLEVIVQEPLLPRGSQAMSSSFLAARMVALARSGATTTDQVDGAYLAGLRERVADLDDDATREPLLAALAHCQRAYGDHGLELGSWHGDWTPWNVARNGEEVLVWDWERFARGVPLGFDALHHHVQEGVVRQGRRPAEVALQLTADAVGILRPFGIVEALAPAVAVFYLVEIGTRYSADGQREAGAALARLDEWLLPALARHTARFVGDVN